MTSSREWYLRSRHKITLKEFDDIENSQNGKCAICNVSKEASPRGLAVDHNHGTGEIRGLLCLRCNLGLGYFKDNIQLMQNAINYLTKGHCYFMEEMKEFLPYPDDEHEVIEDCLDAINSSPLPPMNYRQDNNN